MVRPLVHMGAGVTHGGFIAVCDLVQNTPPALRMKAARILAGTCTLAARIDAYRRTAVYTGVPGAPACVHCPGCGSFRPGRGVTNYMGWISALQ